MPSTQYIGQLIQQNNIDILGICEHWLFPNMLSYLNSIHHEYKGFGVCDKTLDPFHSHHRGKGGVGFIYKKQAFISLLSVEKKRITVAGFVKLNTCKILKL